MAKKLSFDPEKVDPILLANVKRLVGGKAIQALRQEMGDAGVPIGASTLNSLYHGIAGSMKTLRKFAQYFGTTPEDLLIDAESLNDSEPARVKRIHQRLSAGRGHAVYYETKESWLAFQPAFLRKVGVSAHNAAIFDIDGRSMEPELHDGAVVLITMSNRHDTIIDGKHYAFIRGDDCLVKTLYKMPDGTIKAVSQNPDKDEFPDFIIHPETERFEMLGRVLWEGRVL